MYSITETYDKTFFIHYSAKANAKASDNDYCS